MEQAFFSYQIILYRPDHMMINICIGNNTFIIRKVYIAAEYATIDWVWEKRPGLRADGEDDGNSRFYLTVGCSIVAFSSEPVNGKHLAVWLVQLPLALNPRTVGMATLRCFGLRIQELPGDNLRCLAHRNQKQQKWLHSRMRSARNNRCWYF